MEDFKIILDCIQTIAVVISLVYVEKQIRQSTKTTKKSLERSRDESMITYFSNSFGIFYPAILSMEKKIGLEIMKKPATAEIINLIDNDKDLAYKIGQYLTFLETMATGINEKIYDFEVANKLLGSGIISNWQFLKPYVVHLRNQRDMPTLFDQIEILSGNLLNYRSTLHNSSHASSRY